MTKLCLCPNEDVTTYHIYECKTIDYSCNFTSDKKANCGYDYQTKKLNAHCIVKCKDEDTMRLKIAELVNDGKKICGTYVSTLYRNN